MSHHNDCPDSKRLRMLLDGDLPDDEQTRIQSHLETCEGCQRKLESLVAGKESWCGAARQLAETFFVHDAALEEVMHNAKQTLQHGSHGEPSSSGSELNFLEPSTESGTVGRLGHYDIIETVGRGGMGVVLKAFDSSLRRIVAIKVMSQHLAANSAARRRFVREAQAAAAVAYEHVVAIHAVAEKQEPPYIVMQFIEGKTLQDRIDLSGPFHPREILRIGMQTAAGLAAAHAQGLVHRDVKPGNILLENGVERVKLTDFGLARVADDASMTHSGMIAGTPQFMSPEQARGETVDHRSDLFSLGSVLYAMSVGHSPFRASTAMGVLKRVCDESPRPIREVNADIPDWLAGIIAKLLAKNPSERFQSAQEVADLLSQCLAHVQQPLLVALPSELSRIPFTPSTSPAPSQPIAVDQLPAAKPIVGVWRDGAMLVMHRRAQLPDRCVKTNQPTEHYLPRHLYWHRPILYLLFFLNPLIFIVVARLMAKTAEIQIGISRKWMVRRWWAIGLGWIGFMAGAALTVFGVAQMDMLIMLSGIGLALFSGVCSAKIAEVVSVAQIDGEYVFLRGVCGDYLATLPAWNTNEAANPLSAGRGTKSAIPVVHPMFIALFWLGWLMLTAVLAIVAVSRFTSIAANAVPLSWPILIMVIIGEVSLVVTVLVHAIKNRDWRATPLGRRPLIGVAAVSALLVAQLLLLPPWEKRSFVDSRRVHVPQNNVVIFSADPDPALTKQLRELIAQHEEHRKTIRQRFEAGTAPYTDMLNADIELMDAKIRLATAENRMNDVTKLHEELVKVHEEFLKVMQTLFENGVINESDLIQVRTKLTEARIKLETHRKSIAPKVFQVLPREQ